jgi:hypothetical protein
MSPFSSFRVIARAVGRGGSATSHLKRYDIDKVYHKPMAGGHPRETLEASFDIVHDGSGKVHIVEAEAFYVASQVMGLLPANSEYSASSVADQPLWYIRLNHTRLTDAILDLCDVSPQESVRQVCCHILSRFTAPSPHSINARSTDDTKLSDQVLSNQIESLNALLNDAISRQGLTDRAAKNITFFVSECLPLSSDIVLAIDNLHLAVMKLKVFDDNKKDTRREKRLEDAAKSLRSLKNLIAVLYDLNLGPVNDGQRPIEGKPPARPLFISLDLGLNQRRKHYHGGTIFQCIALPNDFFKTKGDLTEHNETIISSSGRGIKIADGGNYSELVRKNRPPGNFVSAIESQYAVARIPLCVGVRFSIGSIVEMVYLASTISSRNAFSEMSSGGEFWQRTGSEKQSMELLRRSLGHPLRYVAPIRVIVASVHGLDEASTPERFMVASHLWNSGIAAEYLPHSGFALSLVNRMHKDSVDSTGSSDWSLLELQGVCALLRVPFIVIVQPHLLKDKGYVRLRRVPFDLIPQGTNATGSVVNTGSFGEAIVSLEHLASTILDASSSRGTEENHDAASVDGTGPPRSGFRDARVDCIFVDHDQYISSAREVSKNETPHYKNTLKAMKGVKHAAQNFLATLPDPACLADIGLEGIPVFAVTEVSFFILREMGTEIMRREKSEMSTAGACAVLMERYPKHRRVLRTLSLAMDTFMKQSHNFWNSTGDPIGSGPSMSSGMAVVVTPSLIPVLLYSKLDDRFDMITLTLSSNDSGKAKSSHRAVGGNVSSSARRR